MAASAGVGLLSAAVPALQARRYPVGDALRVAKGGVTRSSSRVRAALAVAQATLSVVLLLGAGLFVRSLTRAQALELGFEVDRVAYLEPWFLTDGVLDVNSPEGRLFTERARAHLAGMPGIEAVAIGDVPFAGGGTPALRATGHDSVAVPGGGRPVRFRVSSDYLSTIGLQVLEGRDFRPTDGPGAEPVAVVSRGMASALWPEEGAPGKCLYVGGSDSCTTIVGVVQDARVRTIHGEPGFTYYLPGPPALGHIVVRTRGDPASMTSPIQRELMGLDDRVRTVGV